MRFPYISILMKFLIMCSISGFPMRLYYKLLGCRNYVVGYVLQNNYNNKKIMQ